MQATCPASGSVTNSRYFPLPVMVFQCASGISSRCPFSVNFTSLRERQQLWIMRNRRIQIFFHKSFQASPVASLVLRMDGTSREHACDKNRGNQC